MFVTTRNRVIPRVLIVNRWFTSRGMSYWIGLFLKCLLFPLPIPIFLAIVLLSVLLLLLLIMLLLLLRLVSAHLLHFVSLVGFDLLDCALVRFVFTFFGEP